MSEQEAINDVLAGFTPVGEDHPRAVETLDAVKAMLEARSDDTTELSSELVQVDDSRIFRPGDVVVFSTDRPLTSTLVEQIKADLVEQMPGIVPVIVDGLRIEGVYRHE